MMVERKCFARRAFFDRCPICGIQLYRGFPEGFATLPSIMMKVHVYSPPRPDAGKDPVSVHPIRTGMSPSSAQRQAVLRAVGEDNRALAAASDWRSHGGRRGRARPAAAPGRLPLRRRFSAACLVAGVFVFNPAATDVSAFRPETSSIVHQSDDRSVSGDGFAAQAVAAATAERVSDPGRTPFFEFDTFAPVESLQASLPLPGDATPGYAPEYYGPGDALSTPADALPITTLFGLSVRTIVVDAGHGGTDPGAVGALGTKEKDITLDVARRLASRLEAGGRYRVVLTRSGDETVSLARRVDLANATHADLFVSIHVNALPNRHVNVIETYHFDFTEDPAALQLAAIENRNSGMPVGTFRTLLEKIGDTVKIQESRALAQHIQKSMINNVRNHDPKVFDSGVKAAPFVVLVGVDVPAVLVEISCISHRDEELKLRTPQYREKVASFLEEGITTYLDHRQLQARGPAYHEREDASEIARHSRQGS
jgi:N-acetylmuramoyl-L-alanine amidase